MPSEKELLASAEFFAAGLRPPFEPSVCPVCFIFFAGKPEFDGDATVHLLQTKSHAFWDSLIAFVSAEWTAERGARAASMMRRSALRCRRCKPRQKTAERQLNSDYFSIVMEVASKALQHCLLLRGLGGQTKGFVSKRGRWPTSAEQLFPDGPEKTMLSLVGQIEVNPHVSLTIAGLVSVHRPLAFPVLLKAESRRLLVVPIISRLEAAAAAAEADIARIGRAVLPAVRDAVARRHLKTCNNFLLMLYVLAFGPDAKATDALHITYHRELELFRPLSALLDLFERPETAEIHIMRVANHLWHSLSIPKRESLGRSGPPSYAHSRDEATEETLKDPYRALQHYLPEKTSLRSCHGPGCGKRVHDKTTPGAFARCAKCRAVQYCSRECQKADWARAEWPHREICDMLQELFAVASLDMPGAAFSAACAARAFPLARVDTLIRWATNGYTFHDYAHGAPFLHKSLEPGMTMGELYGIEPEIAEKGAFIKILPDANGRVPTTSEVQAEIRKLFAEMDAGIPHDPDLKW